MKWDKKDEGLSGNSFSMRKCQTLEWPQNKNCGKLSICPAKYRNRGNHQAATKEKVIKHKPETRATTKWSGSGEVAENARELFNLVAKFAQFPWWLFRPRKGVFFGIPHTSSSCKCQWGNYGLLKSCSSSS